MMIPASPCGSIETALAGWLAEGRARMGQVLIIAAAPRPDGGAAQGYSLCHQEDAGRTDLRAHDSPEAAIDIARDDEADAYRPLKTAPNLRRGWRLDVPDLKALRLALEGFYPGRLGAFLLWRADRLAPTPLRETLGRQTGMYRVTAKITDAQAEALMGRFCRSDGGCLRTILWRLQTPADPPPVTLPPEKFDPAHDQTGGQGAGGFIPLLCQEACNLLVAEARVVVKGKPAPH
jgi:sirohydrochlorin cobaltochelatase